MKTIYKTILAGLLSSFILVGCGNSQPQLPKAAKVENGVYIIDVMYNFDTSNDNYKRYSNVLKIALRKAAETTLENGFTHFAIVNKYVNNLNGFPLNTYNDMKSYCLGSYETDKELYNKCVTFMPLINYKEELKFVLLADDFDFTISAFDAKELLEEIK